MSAERLDQWLWAVRIFKTRSLAAEACRAGRVTVAGLQAKPARTVRIADPIQVREGEFARGFKVIALPQSRVGAKLVPQYCEEVTPPAEIEKLRLSRQMNSLGRERGLGRPTKRERRRIEFTFGGAEEATD